LSTTTEQPSQPTPKPTVVKPKPRLDPKILAVVVLTAFFLGYQIAKYF